MPTDPRSPLAAAVEALLEAATKVDDTYGASGFASETHYEFALADAFVKMRAKVDALRAALASDAAWLPAEVAPNPHEALGRALCNAAGIDPDAAISDAGHSAWELVAHDALRGVLPAEIRDAAWRARAEAAVVLADAVVAYDDASLAHAEGGRRSFGTNGTIEAAITTLAAMQQARSEYRRRRYEEAARE